MTPCHQPYKLIEGDTAVTILVHLPYQFLQLPLRRRPAESPHYLTELHGGDGSPAVPGHTLSPTTGWLEVM